MILLLWLYSFEIFLSTKYETVIAVGVRLSRLSVAQLHALVLSCYVQWVYLAISPKRKIILKKSSEETARFYFFPGKVNVISISFVIFVTCYVLWKEITYLKKSVDIMEIIWHGARGMSTRVTHLPRKWLPPGSGGIGKIWQPATEAFFVYSTHPPVACLKTPLPSRFFPKGRRGLYPGYPLAGRQPLRL